ncbi:MAG: alpha/beta fold hydrolase [Burkholderiales bacterium]
MDFMVTSDDGAVHTARVLPCARRDAPILLCLPAMGAAAGYYTPFAQALAAQGLGMAALLDLRGQGASSARARRDEFGYREILELDLPAAIARLRKVFGARPLYVLGHSLGGQLALFSAARPGPRPDGLVLIAAGTAYWRDWPAHQQRAARAGFFAVRTAARLLPFYPGTRLGFGGDQPRRLMRDWGRVTREGRYAPEGSDFDYESAARLLALPVLSIGIGEDPIAPESAREALLARLPRSAVARVEIEGIREHTPWKRHFSWARRPEEVVGAIGGWLQGSAARAAA